MATVGGVHVGPSPCLLLLLLLLQLLVFNLFQLLSRFDFSLLLALLSHLLNSQKANEEKIIIIERAKIDMNSCGVQYQDIFRCKMLLRTQLERLTACINTLPLPCRKVFNIQFLVFTFSVGFIGFWHMVGTAALCLGAHHSSCLMSQPVQFHLLMISGFDSETLFPTAPAFAGLLKRRCSDFDSPGLLKRPVIRGLPIKLHNSICKIEGLMQTSA